MTENKPGSPAPWVDPDDAPELTAELVQKGVWRIGDRVVTAEIGLAGLRQELRRGRPPALHVKAPVKLRLDQDLLAALRATGPGWQTRINALLREAVAQGLLK